ncbi:MAG: serine/threonine-protein kinase [Defluviitaleaceae bacterium]|nr:serine/threonine-protein kinase [Defluviitaleaceae bacterium]
MRCNYCFSYHDEGDTCPDCGYVKDREADELFYLYPGTELNNRYIIGRTLGAGGFGIVYKAWDKKEDIPVAIKEYYPSGLVTRTPGMGQLNLIAKNRSYEFEAGSQRFAAECAGTMQIDRQYKNNPALIHNVSCFNYNGTTYLVMELLEGETLTQYVKKNGVIPLDDALKIASAILGAVRDIHNVNIIHRDISPDNIIICKDGTVKLIDFGAAKFGKRDNAQNTERVMKPGYSPPEQYEQVERSGNFTDIYAVGATFYFMLTSYEPTESTNRKTGDSLASPRSLNPQIPQNISDAILKSMAIDHRLRFKDATEFMKALTGEIKVSRPEVELKRRKTKRFFSIAASFLILCIAGFTSYYYIDSIVGALNDASIEVWFILTGDEFIDSQRTAALTQVVEDFNYLHSNIEIELRGIPIDSYESEIESALLENMPILFESGGLSMELLSQTADLNASVNRVRNNVHFLEHYTRFFPARNQMPTGFKVSCIFINTTISTYDRPYADDLTTLLASMPVDTSRVAVRHGSEADFITVFGSVTYVDSLEFFLNDAGALFADTSIHHIMQTEFAGRYRMIRLGTNTVPASFGGIFSVAESSRDEQAAKIRLLEFMLGNHAQRVIHVQHRSGFMPLNINALGTDEAEPRTFRRIFGEFSELLENMESFAFN